ncbi:hypothetical protein [Ferrovibrio xuzhouensis]|uniref:Uncharacterized protein n=1 Tax=Ferrovibrio xuzhouensis TaxID=1576914 RepID=A0ABV7VES8_9PROT
MPERGPSGRTDWAGLDAAAREARLAQKLRANLGRRKQQGRARDAGEAPDTAADRDAPAHAPSGPALDRDGGDA